MILQRILTLYFENMEFDIIPYIISQTRTNLNFKVNANLQF